MNHLFMSLLYFAETSARGPEVGSRVALIGTQLWWQFSLKKEKKMYLCFYKINFAHVKIITE